MTVPSGLKSIAGMLLRKSLSDRCPSAKITESALRISNTPVGCGLPCASSAMTSIFRSSSPISRMLDSHLIFTPSETASSASKA